MRSRKIVRGSAGVAAVLLLCACTALAQQMPKEYAEVLTTLDKKGDYKDDVLKVNIPRGDLKVTVAGISTPTPFGFGGWLGFTKGEHGMDVVMGDLVLLQDEVNPVMSALLDNGLEVTALHNHFFWDDPKVFFMHVHGHGNAVDLAHKVKPALDLIGKEDEAAKSSKTMGQALEGKLNTEKLNQIIGRTGEQIGPVFKFTVGRPDLHVKDMGAVINTRMGLNTWAAFIGSDEKAAVAGDVAMLESEVNPTLKALRQHGLNVVAIHQHMLETHPSVIFLHYWGIGPAVNLATGFRAALDQLGKGTKAAHPHGDRDEDDHH